MWHLNDILVQEAEKEKPLSLKKIINYWLCHIDGADNGDKKKFT